MHTESTKNERAEYLHNILSNTHLVVRHEEANWEGVQEVHYSFIDEFNGGHDSTVPESLLAELDPDLPAVATTLFRSKKNITTDHFLTILHYWKGQHHILPEEAFMNPTFHSHPVALNGPVLALNLDAGGGNVVLRAERFMPGTKIRSSDRLVCWDKQAYDFFINRAWFDAMYPDWFNRYNVGVAIGLDSDATIRYAMGVHAEPALQHATALPDGYQAT